MIKVTASLSDVRLRRAVSVTVEGQDVALFDVDGEISAVENNCPHQHFSVLHQGEVENGCVTCPMHGWTFDLRTGRATNGNGRLKVRAVQVKGGEVFVELRPEADSFGMF